MDTIAQKTSEKMEGSKPTLSKYIEVASIKVVETLDPTKKASFTKAIVAQKVFETFQAMKKKVGELCHLNHGTIKGQVT